MPSEATSPRERPVPPSMIITLLLNPLTSLLTINPTGFIHSKTAESKLYSEQRRGERFCALRTLAAVHIATGVSGAQ